MRNRTIILLFALLLTVGLKAQNDTYKHLDFGIGRGLNYGGFGMSLAFAPAQIVSIEGNMGYNLSKAVMGGALNIHLIPKNLSKTYGLAIKTMYGYNAVLITLDGDKDDRTFYGLSFGLSNELRFGSRKRSGINIDLIIPVRSDAVEEYHNELVDYGYDMSELAPIAFSIGYHIEF